VIGDMLFWLLWPVAILNVGAVLGAQFWASHRKSSGESPSTLPDFLTLFDAFGAVTMSRFYSDLHRQYGSQFISRCIRIARLTLPLTFALILANCVGLIMRF
jgi:hypothetical protein